MATRKTRLNTDSPTSTSGSEANAAVAAPSTPTSAVQKRITRKMLDAKSAADAESALPPPIPTTSTPVAPTEQVSPLRKRTTLTKTASKDELLPAVAATAAATAIHSKTAAPADDDGQSTNLESASDSGSLSAAAVSDQHTPPIDDDPAKSDAGDGGDDGDDDAATTTTEQTDAEAAADATSPSSTPTPKTAAAKRKRNARQPNSLRKVSAGRVGRPTRKSLPTTLKQDLMRRSGSGRAELVKTAAATAAAASAAVVTAAAVVATTTDRKQLPARQTRGEQNLRSSRARQSTTNATAAAAAATSPERTVRVSRKRARTNTTTPTIVKKELVEAEEEEATATDATSSAVVETHEDDVTPDDDEEAEPEEEDNAAVADDDDDDDAEKPPAKLIKTEVIDEETSVVVAAATADTDNEELRRRRSNSVSKCSDTSSNMDVPLQVLKDDAIALVPIKEEPKDESDAVPIAPAAVGKVARKSTPLNDDSGIVVSKTPSPSPVTVAASRPKRSITRPKLAANASPVPSDEPAAAAKVEALLPVLAEQTATTLLTVPNTPSTTTNAPSPVPASEGVSPISVKAFYGQPDFLENNLGIEKDPKLRDIVVQQQHQDKTTKGEANDDDASMEEPLRYEGSIDDDELDKVKVNDIPPTPMECDAKMGDVAANGEQATDVAMPCLTDDPVKSVAKDEMKVDPETSIDAAATTITIDSNPIKPKPETKPAEETDDKENATLCNVKPHTSPNRSPLGAAMAEPQAVPAISSVLGVAAAVVTNLVPESPDALRRKESHFLKLGLLTHEAAVAAKIEQERQRETFQSMHSLAANVAATTAATLANVPGGHTGAGGGNGTGKGKKNAGGGNSSEYTGTLKTVIKLHRPSTSGEPGSAGGAPAAKKKPGRQAGGGALKMTLHKGRGKGGAGAAGSSASGQAGGGSGGGGSGSHSDHSGAGSAAGDEETYYTIHSEAGTDGQADAAVHDGIEQLETKETEKALVIPEKASSFRIHPDKLCQDQCFYCGGKFGLFDTPCHVAGIKSQERQRKILDNEEKLTVDNCLCDACFRHVDRRANCPIYKKRTTNTATANSEYSKMLKAAGLDDSTPSGGVAALTSPSTAVDDCTSQPMDLELPIVGGGGEATVDDGDDSMTTGGCAGTPGTQHHQGKMCQVSDCGSLSAHSIRRKWFMKMRKQIGKLLNLNGDAGTVGGGMLAICGQHYNVIGHLMVCTLCKRKLVRNHIYYINQDIAKLEELLAAQGLPMTIGQSPIVCKLCRYFSNLLLKPPEKPQKVKFVKEYRRRLLQFFNVDVLDETDESQSAHDNPQNPAHIQPANQATIQPHAAQPYAAIAQRKSRTSKGSRKSSRADDSSMSLPSSVEPVHASRDSADTPPPTHTSSSASNQIPTTAELLAEYDQSPSITIVPRPKSTTAATPSSTKKQIIVVETGNSPTGSAHPTKEDLCALRANPNISMRELFPGEEDLGLHVNVPFGTVSQRTPDGWFKNQMTVQYDEQTRHLWEELQKPYGNQSSFMRHLILLEKYFRNGDLVLMAGASSSAQTYADSVQQRLSSYDNRPAAAHAATAASAAAGNAATTSLSALANSLFSPNIYNKSTTTANVSITPTLPKSAGKSTAANCSLLKPKQRMSDGGAVDKSAKDKQQGVTLPPELICINTSNKQHMSITQSLQQYSQKNAAAAVSATSSAPSSMASASPVSPTLGHSGATDHAGRQSHRHHDSMLGQSSTSTTSVGGASTSTGKQRKQNSGSSSGLNNSGSKPSTSAAAAAADAASAAVAAAAAAAGKGSASTSSSSSASACDANVIRLPDVLTAEERLESQMWRPTLMPVSAAPAALNGQMYQTADGRKLPNLVQVQSGGNPYLISIHDYNRMCILRRERLLRDQVMQRQQQQQQQQQHHQHQQLPGAPANNHGSGQQPLSNSTSPGLAGSAQTSTPKANTNAPTSGSSAKANRSAGSSMSSAANQKVQIPNKILEQNSLIPLANSHNPHAVHAGLSGTGGKSGSSTNALDSLLKTRKPNPTSLLKQNQGKAGNSGSSNVVSITSTPSIAAILGVNPSSSSSLQQQQQQMLQNQQMMHNQQIIQQQFFQQQLAYQTMNNNIPQRHAPNVTATLHGPSGVGPLDALIKAASQSIGSGGNNNSASASAIPNNIRMWAEALSRNAAVASGVSAAEHDNAVAAATLLSKIPKSLTVIPQQKESSSSSGAAASGSSSSHGRRSTKASMLGLDGTM